jgi:hypothetical protein
VLNHDTHPRVSTSRSSRPFQWPPTRASTAGLRCSSVLKREMTDSAMALSKLSPTVPMEGAAPMSSRRSVWAMEVYCGSDYAEVFVMPRDRGLACASGAAWRVSRLNVSTLNRFSVRRIPTSWKGDGYGCDGQRDR